MKSLPVRKTLPSQAGNFLTLDTKPPGNVIPAYVEFLPLKSGLESPLEIILEHFFDEQLDLRYHIENK